MMKKIFVILLLNSLFLNTLISQTLIQQIENAYKALDSISYIENIILSYKEDLAVREDIMINHAGDLNEIVLRPTYHHLDLIQRQNIIDSLMKNMSFRSKNQIEENTANFISAIKDKPVCYILNLMFEKHEQTDRYSFLSLIQVKCNLI